MRGPRRRARRAPTLEGLALTLALTGSSLGVLACEGEPDPRPNLLLVSVDALRADRLACYGGEAGLGSAICSLAEGGGRQYRWAFATATTGASSAASILTSLYPSQHGVGASPADFLTSERRTLAEELALKGYTSAAFVSQSELNSARHLDQGFALYDERLEASPGKAPRRDARSTTRLALRWIETAPSPWFVWVHYGDLHGPPPAAVPSYEEYEARYREAIQAVDGAVARLVSSVAERERRFGVLLTATHGEAIGERGEWFAHGHSLGLEQARVPLFWRPPGSGSAAAALTVSRPVSTLAVAPTLLRAAGRMAPDGLEGEALPREIEPEAGGEPPAPLFIEHPDEVAVVVASRFYVRGRAHGSPARAVRFGEDPGLPRTRPVVSSRREAADADHMEALLRDYVEPPPAAAEPTGPAPGLELGPMPISIPAPAPPPKPAASPAAPADTADKAEESTP